MIELKRTTKNQKAKRVGRGGTRGKTSGRGTKGQKARAGHRIRPHIRDTIKKLPKLRGRGKNSNKSVQVRTTVINLKMLEASFATGEKVTPGALLKKGLISRTGGMIPHVKILAEGDLTKALMVYNCEVSAGAAKKITDAKGTINS